VAVFLWTKRSVDFEIRSTAEARLGFWTADPPHCGLKRIQESEVRRHYIGSEDSRVQGSKWQAARCGIRDKS
jgi:hypothetical protein